MSQPLKPRGLGRGLSALLGDEDVAATVAPPIAAMPPRPANRAPTTLPTAHLHAGKYQPRTTFEHIDALVESVKQYGLLQPILVRPIPGVPDGYEIVAGERRWRAAQKAQLHEVPVVIRTLDDLDALQLALVENLQRSDLSAVDEAQGYRRLMTDFNQTQDEIAHTMGKSRPHIANTLRLLDLPEGIREMIRRDEISAGHGRQLLTFPDPEAVAARVVAEKLSVRDLEKLAAGERLKKASGGGNKRSPAPSASKSADTKALEKRIEEALGLKASLHEGSGEKTVLTLQIDNYDQLDTVVERLTRR
ncbi:MAG: ParB/RepB/Spo0J family partition protein [Reyranella sp.]|uniref:ParB/RepB/Spo0J family partition protein n=1 Tax=Reyranella sp. TaxID=1929291 RepID=UPI001AD15A38|nr:ParB/RepB/Spo0J family partition protein [Reyranella sp.]MBN9087429.1 ParB/RepB/Spo0J family partition protein [Reyranella sp.]